MRNTSKAQSDCPRVFVYGTLKPGGAYWGTYCEGRVLRGEPAKVRGDLYDLRLGYPALTEGEGWAHGWLLILHDVKTLARLDELEDYVEGRASSENEYERVLVTCFSANGGDLGKAWCYRMERERVERLGGVKLPSGIWNSGTRAAEQTPDGRVGV